MNLAYGVVLKLIESSEGRLVLKLYKLMMHLPLLQWMDLSTLMYQKLEQSPMLLGMLLDLDHEGPNPYNYLERHNFVDHDQEKHKLDKNLYMHISFWKSKEIYESLDHYGRGILILSFVGSSLKLHPLQSNQKTDETGCWKT